MPPCGDLQGDTVADLVICLGLWVRDHPEFCLATNEIGIHLGDDTRGADAAIWRRADLGAYHGGIRRVPPVLAVEVVGTRQSIPWFFAWLFMTVMAGVFDFLLSDAPVRMNMQMVAVFFVLNFAAISLMIYALLWYFASEKQKLRAQVDLQHEQLRMEKERSERLLLNVLPHSIAERLKRGESNIAQGHADVTVMFADIVGFTKMTEELSPVETVKILNDVFSMFDEIAERLKRGESNIAQGHADVSVMFADIVGFTR